MEDAGFQLLNDEEIIAEVRHSPKEDEEEDNDEGENDSQKFRLSDVGSVPITSEDRGSIVTQKRIEPDN
ncbi:hypothetical protein AVEN_2192-1 [Araneus ventricosus]|uniref:Uncharacterized protein n=1 Tax=Araneus ventricosus TaxID=182803 RepID=A0A4Y2TXQ6_ARAVE|nr:hypothetical protein AVEN_2192-1 [Araneus ventricosus]